MEEPNVALIVRYGLPFPGREQAALALQDRVFAHLCGLRDASRLAEVRCYALLSGPLSEHKVTLVIEGTREAVQELSWSKAWKMLLVQAGCLAANVRVDHAVGGRPESLEGPRTAFSSFVNAIDEQ